jgi:SWI/SNF related-matrix-associated actin-dependent regulator of chromatin subfamily C
LRARAVSLPSDSAWQRRRPLQDQARKYLEAQTHEVIFPSYSAWFYTSKIHPVERRALPEFLNSRNHSKTPSICKDYRDFMINAHRLRTSEYLSVTACRRNLAGDVCAVVRCHAYARVLEQWGMISYQASFRLFLNPESRPATSAPPLTDHYCVILGTPRGLQSLHPGTRPSNPSAQDHCTSQILRLRDRCATFSRAPPDHLPNLS